MDHSLKSLRRVFLAIALGAQFTFAWGDTPLPFEAKLEVLRNDKAMGEATVSLISDGEEWSMRSTTTGTRGLAKFLGLEETTVSEGRWVEDAPRPTVFDQKVKVSIKKEHTRAEFFWDDEMVLSKHEDGEDHLPTRPGLVDPGTVGLVVRQGLRREEGEWNIPTVDEERIDEDHYRFVAEEQIETALGCLKAHRVDKIRGPESTRYTRTYYAASLDYVPVLVEHGKTDGDHMETRLLSLTLDGEAVDARPPCSDS